MVKKLRPLLESNKKNIIGQNIKFDRNILAQNGVNLGEIKQDTMLMSYVIDASATRHNMDALAKFYLNHKTTTFEEVAGKGVKQISFDQVPLSEAADYASEDADITLRLFEKLNPLLQEIPTLKNLSEEIEVPLIMVLSDMEVEGIKINIESLKEFSKKLNVSLANLEQSIYNFSGHEFNIDSPKQLGEVVFGELNLDPKAKKTKTGQFKTDEPTLNKLSGSHPIIDDILSYRTRKKLLSTYVDALPKLISPLTNKIHTNYMQTVTSTGRLSSNKPNLQNIPIRTELGKEIRKAFCSRERECSYFCRLLSN